MAEAKRRLDNGERVLGTLLMSTPILVLEISRNGCLLESECPIDAGAAGKLRVAMDGRSYSEEVRITRCQRLEGTGTRYRLGAEFLPTRRPSSLRRAIHVMLDAYKSRVFGGEAQIV